jgi:hypothetical protein
MHTRRFPNLRGCRPGGGRRGTNKHRKEGGRAGLRRSGRESGWEGKTTNLALLAARNTETAGHQLWVPARLQ